MMIRTFSWGLAMVTGALLAGCASEVLYDDSHEDAVYYRMRGHVVAPGSFFPERAGAEAVNAAAEALGQQAPFDPGCMEKWNNESAGRENVVAVEGVWKEPYSSFRRGYGLPVRVFWVGKSRGNTARAEDEVVPVYAEVLVAESPYSRKIINYLALDTARPEFIEKLNSDYLRSTKGGAARKLVGAGCEERGRILADERPRDAGGDEL